MTAAMTRMSACPWFRGFPWVPGARTLLAALAVLPCAFGAAAAQSQAAPQGGGITALLAQLFPILMMIVIFYVLVLRPQQKRHAELKKMIENLKKGDRVLTQGGMYGTVVGINGDMCVLRVAEDVKIEFAKSSIVGLAGEKKQAAEKT